MTAAATSATLPASTAIVGAGPTGLFTALVLARRGYRNITVYDRLPRPDDPSSPNWGNPYRSYNLGLGARGQIALGAAEVWDSIEPFCAQAIGRKDWTPEQGERPEQIYTERYGGGMGGSRDKRAVEERGKEKDDIQIEKEYLTLPPFPPITSTLIPLPPSLLSPSHLPSKNREYKTQVIQRDRIASCLLMEVEKEYKDQISVLHDVECVGLTWLDEEAGAREEAKGGSQQRRGVRVRLHRELEEGKLEQWTEDARWVIGADGVRSALRGALEAKTTPSPNNKKKTEKPVRAHKLPERNEFVYKILPLDLRPKYGTGPGWRPDLNYSARTKGEVTIEALPTKEGLYIGVVLFRPTCPAIAAIEDKEDARHFFAGSFPQFIDVIKEEDLARFATSPTFRLPNFSYAGPNINYKDNTLLLGDCIHSVKPYFGLGLNSALEDVMSLNRCLDETGDDLGKVRNQISRLSLRGMMLCLCALLFPSCFESVAVSVSVRMSCIYALVYYTYVCYCGGLGKALLIWYAFTTQKKSFACVNNNFLMFPLCLSASFPFLPTRRFPSSPPALPPKPRPWWNSRPPSTMTPRPPKASSASSSP